MESGRMYLIVFYVYGALFRRRNDSETFREIPYMFRNKGKWESSGTYWSASQSTCIAQCVCLELDAIKKQSCPSLLCVVLHPLYNSNRKQNSWSCGIRQCFLQDWRQLTFFIESRMFTFTPCFLSGSYRYSPHYGRGSFGLLKASRCRILALFGEDTQILPSWEYLRDQDKNKPYLAMWS